MPDIGSLLALPLNEWSFTSSMNGASWLQWMELHVFNEWGFVSSTNGAGGIMGVCRTHPGASLVAQMVKDLPLVGTRAWSLGGKDPLEKEMVTHSSILAWRIPWTEEPGRLYVVHGHKESDTTEWLTLQNSVLVALSPIPNHLMRLDMSLFPLVD